MKKPEILSKLEQNGLFREAWDMASQMENEALSSPIRQSLADFYWQMGHPTKSLQFLPDGVLKNILQVAFYQVTPRSELATAFHQVLHQNVELDANFLSDVMIAPNNAKGLCTWLLIELEIKTGTVLSRLRSLEFWRVGSIFDEKVQALSQEPAQTIDSLNVFEQILLLRWQIQFVEIGRSERQRQLKWIMTSLNPDERKIYEPWLVSISDTIEIQLLVNEKKLRVNEREVDFSKRKSLFQILSYISEHPTCHFAELTEAVWKTPYNSSFNHRIRMAIQRINEILASELNGIRLLKTDQEHVICQKSIKRA